MELSAGVSYSREKGDGVARQLMRRVDGGRGDGEVLVGLSMPFKKGTHSKRRRDGD